MFTILLNSIGLCLTGSLGRLVKGRIKDRQISAIYTVVGALVLVIGLQGVLDTSDTLPITLSLFIGTLIGSGIRIEDRISSWANGLIREDGSDFVNGIIAVALITCMGSLAILGPLNIVLKNDPTLMNFKTLLDSIMGLVFGTVYGKSVYPAALVLFIYQMFFYILAKVIAPVLDQATISQIGQVGSIILILLALNLLKLKEIKIMDTTPSLIFPIIFSFLGSILS